MTKPIARDPIYRRRRFNAEIIELCVRWYITYRLSYRDLVAMMAERGIVVSHTTILRWVTRYVPEFERRWNRFARPVNLSWRVDETYINVRGKWNFLYQASTNTARRWISCFARIAAGVIPTVEALGIMRRDYTGLSGARPRP
jgi:transposase-like protein